ncbi:MAG: integration host factor subunit beta [Pseudonocardia sp.]|nr:integration host factor subunit beta [Pseudonocardia sp.]
MNKAQLVDALAARLGDRRTAAAAVDGVVDVIVETVGAGDSVTLTGFGVFEARRRAARVARNPRTGETVPVPETVVPSFRAGAAFRDRIGDSAAAAAGATSAPRRLPRPSARVSGAAVTADGGAAALESAEANGTESAGTKLAAGKPAAGKSAAKTDTTKPATRKKTTAGSSATDKGSTAKGATAKSPTAKPAASKPAASKPAASKPAASKPAATKSTKSTKKGASTTTTGASTTKTAPTKRSTAEK